MQDHDPTSALVARLTERLYGRPLVRNVLRGELVEQMVLDALGPEWCAGDDYQSWDVKHRTVPLRLQVKQAAARQTWHRADERSVPRFSIGERTAYSGATGQSDQLRARHAEAYIFAWHPLLDKSVDHRDPAQWLLYVVSVARLPPDQETVGLQGLNRLVAPVRINSLPAAIAELLP